MSKARKFKPGATLTPMEAVLAIMCGRWIYIHHKPYHPGWSTSWPLRTIINYASAGVLRAAMPQEKK